MSARRLRYGTLFALLLVIASIAVPSIRHLLLRAAGWVLVVNDRVGPADVIVISGEGDSAGALEASDLYHNGVASRVAVFSYTRDVVEREFAGRGISYQDKTARLVGELRALGFTNVEHIPTYINGTESEGAVLARWCDEQRFHFVVVVGTRDHSRRLRRVLHRSLEGRQTIVAICSSRYSKFDPDQWWDSRDGIRTEIMESEKLLLDILGHPVS